MPGPSVSEDVARFDRWSSTYESSPQQSLMFDPVHRRVLDILAGIVQPEVLLDVGCGTGRLLRAAARRWPSARLIGVDPAPGMLDVARRLTPEAAFHGGFAEHLPLDDGSVHVALSTVSFHHWQSQADGVREVARVLRPGGYFFLTDMSAPAWLIRLGFTHFLDLGSVRDVFQSAGLRVVRQQRILMGRVLVTVGRREGDGSQADGERQPVEEGCGQPVDYGQDGPGFVCNLALGGAGALIGAGLLRAMSAGRRGRAGGLLEAAGLVTGLVCFGEAARMIYYSRVEKLRLRESLVDALALRGDETVLDAGCGRGLLLNAAARRLAGGQAVGLDLWRAGDLSGNEMAATWHNARCEGVAGRIRLETGDMQEMPFPASHFDAVVSSLAIHNIHEPSGRARAIGEIARVLKPGGRVALLDLAFVETYAETLRGLGWRDVRVSSPCPLMVPPVHLVTATKPGAQAG